MGGSFWQRGRNIKIRLRSHAKKSNPFRDCSF